MIPGGRSTQRCAGSASGPARPRNAARCSKRSAAAPRQEGGLQVTGRRQPLPGHEVNDGVLLRHRPMNLLPGGTSYVSGLGRGREGSVSPGRRTILHTAFIDGVIRRFPGDSAWWLTDNDDQRFMVGAICTYWPPTCGGSGQIRPVPPKAKHRLNPNRRSHSPVPESCAAASSGSC